MNFSNLFCSLINREYEPLTNIFLSFDIPVKKYLNKPNHYSKLKSPGRANKSNFCSKDCLLNCFAVNTRFSLSLRFYLADEKYKQQNH